MIAKDMLLSFLEYNYQADMHVVEHLEQLTPQQLHTVTTLSHATAFDLVRHMLDTEWSWRLFASGGAGQQYVWDIEELPDLPALRRFWSAERDRMLMYVGSHCQKQIWSASLIMVQRKVASRSTPKCGRSCSMWSTTARTIGMN